MDYRETEIMRYLQSKIPIILDIKNQNLVFDARDIHYKIYKYILELKEKQK